MWLLPIWAASVWLDWWSCCRCVAVCVGVCWCVFWGGGGDTRQGVVGCVKGKHRGFLKHPCMLQETQTATFLLCGCSMHMLSPYSAYNERPTNCILCVVRTQSLSTLTDEWAFPALSLTTCAPALVVACIKTAAGVCWAALPPWCEPAAQRGTARDQQGAAGISSSSCLQAAYQHSHRAAAGGWVCRGALGCCWM
jgi:hypothetical protein